MKLAVTYPVVKSVDLSKFVALTERDAEEPAGIRLLVVQIEPSFYRDIEAAVKLVEGKVEVLVHAVKPESDTKFDDEDD